jgi:hypothetical protein
MQARDIVVAVVENQVAFHGASGDLQIGRRVVDSQYGVDELRTVHKCACRATIGG